jgi:hypothetical protein
MPLPVDVVRADHGRVNAEVRRNVSGVDEVFTLLELLERGPRFVLSTFTVSDVGANRLGRIEVVEQRRTPGPLARVRPRPHRRGASRSKPSDARLAAGNLPSDFRDLQKPVLSLVDVKTDAVLEHHQWAAIGHLVPAAARSVRQLFAAAGAESGFPEDGRRLMSHFACEPLGELKCWLLSPKFDSPHMALAAPDPLG